MPPPVGLKPPIARREENRKVYAGKAPWLPPHIPRQAKDSQEVLMETKAIKDPYGWIRDDKRESKEVMAHLQAETDYAQAMTAHLEGLRKTLYDEMLSSIQETDYSVPRPDGKYYRYSRTFEGKSYSTYCRAPKESDEALKIKWDGSAETPILPGEEIVLDVNALAEGKDYCSVGALSVSPSKKLLAYSADFSGNEKYVFFIQNLETKEIIFHDKDLEISGGLAWGKDDSTIFYLKMDDTKRPYQLWRKRFALAGLEAPADEMIHEEKDPQFWSGVHRTLDNKYLFLEMGSSETSEFHFIDLEDDLEKAPSKTNLCCIAKRRYKVLYDVDHRNGYWWITSKRGDETPNMRLFTAPATANCEKEWTLVTDPSSDKPLFDGGYDRTLDDATAFKTHVIAHGREGGIPRVWVLSLDDSSVSPKVIKFEPLSFEEEAYDAGISSHYEFDTKKIMVAYDSMITPLQYLEDSLQDLSQRHVVKQKNVPGYNKDEFDCDRFFVTSRDGKTQIPVLLVFQKKVMEEHLKTGKTVPTHLYGYGSYGACIEADFRATRLPLLRRGIIYVIAQIRGGGEMGRQWYEEPNGAKYLCKKNTFNDFVDVARHLIYTKKLTSAEQLSCEGRSAGGMLIGSSINQAPELFKVAILGVPFVDVVCTMIDATIPLTTNEWEEVCFLSILFVGRSI